MNEVATTKLQPWKTEPDRKEWRHAGLPCLIVRNELGALCGYAAVAPGHPLYGSEGDDLSVHGGITYVGKCTGRICHVARPGEPDDVYWFGFDCAHCFDIVPALLPGMVFEGSSYKDMAFVTREVEQLAEQLAACFQAGGHHAR